MDVFVIESRPNTKEAIRFVEGMDLEEICSFVTCEVNLACGDDDDVIALEIVTKEGTMEVKNGDYIIKGLEGEFYPCDPEIFYSSYNIIDKVVDK